jgi:hypothetical protein
MFKGQMYKITKALEKAHELSIEIGEERITRGIEECLDELYTYKVVQACMRQGEEE